MRNIRPESLDASKSTMKPRKNDMRLIETDAFPFEFLSQLAERESWRKEVHRPIYHVHKWWAKRLGSVFRGILLGTSLPRGRRPCRRRFTRSHRFRIPTVFDPFMGSGTTIGEAHKLGFTALGRDINPVAVESVRTALGPMDQARLEAAFDELSQGVGKEIRALYRSKDSRGRPCDVLYFFWVMQVPCLECRKPVDLFPSWVIARNAYPQPQAGGADSLPRVRRHLSRASRPAGGNLPLLQDAIRPRSRPGQGSQGDLPALPSAVLRSSTPSPRTGTRPDFRLYGKLVLTRDGAKEYLPATADDHAAYQACSARLKDEAARGDILLPTLALEHGYNTRQAMSYGFTAWRDFFNDRQLLALGWLHRAIGQHRRRTDARSAADAVFRRARIQ